MKKTKRKNEFQYLHKRKKNKRNLHTSKHREFKKFSKVRKENKKINNHEKTFVNILLKT